jgi:L-ascorbate metabolism protein UlaG (beta-lactamase superfamily)
MTMDAAEAARLVAAVEPRRVVPIHHHTFSHYTEPATALVDRLAEGSPREALRLVEEGETVVVD